MSNDKPDDIPQDVWDKANPLAIDFIDWVGRPSIDGDAEFIMTQLISRAILKAKNDAYEEAAELTEWPYGPEDRPSNPQPQAWRQVIHDRY